MEHLFSDYRGTRFFPIKNNKCERGRMINCPFERRGGCLVLLVWYLLKGRSYPNQFLYVYKDQYSIVIPH